MQTVNLPSSGAAEAQLRDRDLAYPDAEQGAEGTTAPAPSTLNVPYQAAESCSYSFSRLGDRHATRSSNMAPLPVTADMQGSLQQHRQLPAAQAPGSRPQVSQASPQLPHSSSPQALGSTHVYATAPATNAAEAQASQLHSADAQPPQSSERATDDTIIPALTHAAAGLASRPQHSTTSQGILAPGAALMHHIQVAEGQLLMVPLGYLPLYPSSTTSLYASVEQLPLRLQPVPNAILEHTRKRYEQAFDSPCIMRIMTMYHNADMSHTKHASLRCLIAVSWASALLLDVQKELLVCCRPPHVDTGIIGYTLQMP